MDATCIAVTLQGLAAPITDLQRLMTTDQRLYLFTRLRDKGEMSGVGGSRVCVLGGIKVGTKHLFIRKVSGLPSTTNDVYIGSYGRGMHWLYRLI